MKNIASKLTRFWNQLRGFFPESLPVGVTAFNDWSQAIADTYSLPTQDIDSVRFTLASIIMHLGPQAAYKSKWYFAVTLRASAAKQVAGACFYDIKQKQKEAQDKAKAVEATAQASVASFNGA